MLANLYFGIDSTNVKEYSRLQNLNTLKLDCNILSIVKLHPEKHSCEECISLKYDKLSSPINFVSKYILKQITPQGRREELFMERSQFTEDFFHTQKNLDWPHCTL